MTDEQAYSRGLAKLDLYYVARDLRKEPAFAWQVLETFVGQDYHVAFTPHLPDHDVDPLMFSCTVGLAPGPVVISVTEALYRAVCALGRCDED